MPAGKNWTREEVILAMNLYTRLNFGQFHGRNPEVIKLAGALERTPGSIALKLSNLASLDSFHQDRGVSGMGNASTMDRAVWTEFQNDWDSMGLLSEEMMQGLKVYPKLDDIGNEALFYSDSETEKKSIVAVRTKQQFFRRAVLTGYQSCCCITGNPIPELLTASHILPWSDYKKDRLNPSNGLCLAKTQDTAFDGHLITLDEDCRVVVSKSIKDHFAIETVRDNFEKYEGVKITMPERFLPDPQFLEIHRQKFLET